MTRKLGVDTGEVVDARTLEDLDRTVEERRVFGRVTPDQKRAMVGALQRGGHTVAMTGDGVNDVLALKDANIGVAMGSGAPATRAVAKIVLLDDKFATLPHVVAEGRRVIDNIERVANLFLAKTIYSAMLAALVILTSVPFPFQPIHVTITGWFTIGVPAFILALPPNHQRAQEGFVARILWFAVPSGVLVGASAFGTYWLAAGGAFGENTTPESTAALIIPSTWVLACVARPYTWWKIALVALPLLGYGLIFSWGVTQRLFALDSSHAGMMAMGVGVGLCAAAGVEAVWWIARRKLNQPARLWQRRQ